MNEDGRLQINLLGKPEVWLDGVQATSFSTSKTEALLYYLAATRQTHSRETLAGLLWGEMPEAKAKRNLTKSLSVLRRLLAPFLIIEPQRVGFDPDAEFVLDVTLFETACTELAETAVSSSTPPSNAITLYRDDFLDGFFVKDALAFEEWQLTQRERLRGKAIVALATLATIAAEQKNYANGIAYSRRLLQLDPWRESAHRQLMLLLARHGQQAAALAQYEKCRQLLDNELGVAPSAETNALYQRLRLARDRVAAPLPEDGTQFVGRQRELTFVLETATQAACRLLTIIGLGGMGKTRLALAAAQQITKGDSVPFLNGVLFVPLDSVTSGDGMLAAILAAMGVAPKPGRQLDQVITNLQQQELLLILDNFEDLIAEVDSIQRIVSACPDVTLLVTSRESLGLSAEHRLDLGGLSAPPYTDVIQNIEAYEAVELFVTVARQMQLNFSLDAATTPHVLQICRLTDGVPLAIKLAATWLRALPVAEIAAQLQANLDILATRMHDVPARQRSMRAIFDQTMALLTAEEASVLVGLSVFRGGFSAAAARQVANATPLVLGELVDRGLIQLDETGRYRLHELLRQFTAERRDREADIAHAQYFAEWMAARMPEIRDARQGEALRLIALEFANIKVAWHLALTTYRFDLIQPFITPFSRFAHLRGRYPEGIAMLETAIERCAAHGEARLEAQLHHALGTLYFFSGNHVAAKQAYQTALRLAEKVEDNHIQANATFHLAQVLHFNGDAAEAFLFAERAHQHYTQEDNAHGLIGSMNMLGQLHRRQGHSNEARRWFQAAIDLGRVSHDYAALLVPLNNFGLLLHELGDFEDSLALFAESEALVEKLGQEKDGLVMLNFGRNYEALGEIERAAALYEGAIPVFEAQHARHYVLVACSWAARTARLRGDLAQAHKWNSQALHGFRQANTLFSIADASANLGDIELDRGDLDAAESAYSESLKLMRRLGWASGELRAVTALAQVALRRQAFEATRKWLETGLHISSQIHHVMLQHRLLVVLAIFFVHTGERQHGLALLNWIQQQSTASWETRQLAKRETAVFHNEMDKVKPIDRSRSLKDLLTLTL